MSYIRDRYHSTEGWLVRLFMRFYQNGQLADPSSFGPVVIAPEHDPNQILATFNSPVRYSTGYYYVEWRIPNTEVGLPYYDTLFAELVTRRLERNYRDTWRNVTIGDATFTTFGNFYVAPAEVEIEFDTRNIMRFQFSLVKDQLPKGSKDYVTIQAIELNNRLAAGLSGWPDGQIAIKQGESMIRNWESALHQSNLNEYAVFVDTDGLRVGPYFAKLRFGIPESSSERAAQIVGTRNLTNGYSPDPARVQVLSLNVDGQRHDIPFTTNATRGSVAGEGHSWALPAKIESSIGIAEPIITLDTVQMDLIVDGFAFSVTFVGASLRIADVASQINAASMAALGYPIAESFIEGTDTKIRIFSNTRGSWTYNETIPPTPPTEIAHVRINWASASLAEIGFIVSNEGWGTDLTATITPAAANNMLRLSVRYPGSSASGFQVVNFPVGYWAASEIINMLNGVTPFNQALIMSQNDAPVAPVGYPFTDTDNTFVLEANLAAGSGTALSTVTFSTGTMLLATVIADMTAQFALDGLDVTVDTVPVGAPPADRIRIRSNVMGAASLLAIHDGTGNTLLGFAEGDVSRGGDPLQGATASLNGNRVQIAGDTVGYTSILKLDSEVNGSTINTLLGFPSGGTGDAHGTNPLAAQSIGSDSPALPLGVVSSTQAYLKSDPLGLLSLGGTTLDLQVDDTRFTVNFTEVETYARIVGSVPLPVSYLPSVYKIYTSNTLGANRQIASPIMPDNRTLVDEPGSPGIYLGVNPAEFGAFLIPQLSTPMNIQSFYSYWVEVQPFAFLLTYPAISTITGTTSGATANCEALVVSKGRCYVLLEDLTSAFSFSHDIVNEFLHFNASGNNATQAAGILPDRSGAFHTAITLMPYAPLPAPIDGCRIYDALWGIQLAVIEHNDGTWMTLSNLAHTFAPGDNLFIGTAFLQVGPYIVDDVIGEGCASFSPTSVDLTANWLVVQANSGPPRTIIFTPDVSIPITTIINTINAAFTTFGDQARAVVDGSALAIESTVPGATSQIGLFDVTSDSNANIPFGLPQGTLTTDRSAAPATVGMMYFDLTVNRIGEAIGLHNLRGVFSQITQGGAAGTITSVFGEGTPASVNPIAIVTYRLETPGTPFINGPATFNTAPPLVKNITVLPLATGVLPVGTIFSEVGWYDDGVAEGQNGFIGYLQTLVGDEATLVAAGATYLPNSRSVLLAQQPGGAPQAFWPVGAFSRVYEAVGTATPLNASNIADQINTEALSSGVPYTPAGSTGGGELELQSQEFGSTSRLLIWGGTAHADLCLFPHPSGPLPPHVTNPNAANVIAALETDVINYTAAGAWDPGSVLYVDTNPPQVPPHATVQNYGDIATTWSSDASSGSLAVFGLDTSTVVYDLVTPWPTTVQIEETAGTGSIPTGQWAYGSVGRDGNDVWRLEINGTEYAARIGVSVTSWSDLTSVLTSLFTGRAIFSPTGGAPLYDGAQVKTTGTGTIATLRVLGYQEDSTGPEGFGWGSTRVQLANPRGLNYDDHEQLLLMPAATFIPDPAWIGQVGARLDGFNLLIGNPTDARPNIGAQRFVGYISGNIVNGNYLPIGLTCMVPADQWHRACAEGDTAITFPITFTPNTRDLVLRGGDGYGSPPTYDVTRRIRFELLTSYDATQLTTFLSYPRLGVTWVAPWPSTWATAPSLDTAQLVYQADTGSGDLLLDAEGFGTLRLAGLQCMLIRFLPAGPSVFNDRDYVRWRDTVGPGPWQYGWILKQTSIGGINLGVFLVVDDYAPPDTGYEFENLTVPGNTGDSWERWADEVRFMIGRDITGYARAGGPGSAFSVLQVAAQPCTFTPCLSFSIVAGKLRIEDLWLPGAHESGQPHGELFVHPTNETTAWYELGLPTTAASVGLYDRVGGGHLDGLGSAEPPAWGGDATPPILLAAVPINPNNWVTATPNSSFVVRIDNEVGMANDGWLTATLNPNNYPIYLTLWEIIDLLNGRGSAYGFATTYPVTPLLGYNTLILEVDGVALPPIVFTVGTAYELDDVVKQLNDDVAFTATAVAENFDNQLLIYSKTTGIGSSLRIADYTGGSTINGWLGFSPEGVSSVAVGAPVLEYGAISRAVAVPSVHPADGGQLRLASLRVQTNTDDSAMEVNSRSSGSTANGTLGFSDLGAGPAFGKMNDVTYPLTGTGGLVELINNYYGGLVVADAAGSFLRLTSIAQGLDAVVEILSGTDWDVQNQFGLTPKTINGTEFRTVAQTVVSPWLQFQVV